MARWRVHIIRRPAEQLATVEAANAYEALKIAAKKFDIPPGAAEPYQGHQDQRPGRLVTSRTARGCGVPTRAALTTA
jgi:hypothetical protein